MARRAVYSVHSNKHLAQICHLVFEASILQRVFSLADSHYSSAFGWVLLTFSVLLILSSHSYKWESTWSGFLNRRDSISSSGKQGGQMRRVRSAGTISDFMILWNLVFNDFSMCQTTHLNCGLWRKVVGFNRYSLNGKRLKDMNEWPHKPRETQDRRAIAPHQWYFVILQNNFQNNFRDFLKNKFQGCTMIYKASGDHLYSSSPCIISPRVPLVFQNLPSINLN